MSYYPAWLDYAMWIFIGCGFLCGLAMMPQEAGRKRGLLKLGACLLIATGAICGGTAGLLFNLRAAHLSLSGTISRVYIHHGGKSSTTYFDVEGAQLSKGFSIGRSVPQIAVGEDIDLLYQADSNLVLNLRVRSGRNAHYDYVQSDNSGGSILVIVLAGALALYGIMDFLSDGTAIPQPNDDDGSEPPADVDTESMLHL